MKFELPDIPEAEQTPVVKGLLALVEQLIEQVHRQQEEIDTLKDEVRVLKGQKKRPRFKPSKLDESTGDDDEPADSEGGESKKKRPARRNKQAMTIHRDECIRPDNLPEGSRFKGYQDFVVQELVIRNENIRYRLERWLTPDGRLLSGRLPASLEHRHYGPELVSYLLYQHHHSQVTQPLLLEQLREWGILISAGQLNRLLSEDKDRFHAEKDSLLEVGLARSGHVTVDDSGARHQGRNGYVTHIGNDFFAWFGSTESKSRINFLTLLQGSQVRYRLSEDALAYMCRQKLPQALRTALAASLPVEFTDEAAWQALLQQLDISDSRHRRIATEGALLGALLHHADLSRLAIISDGAGQFNVMQHGLCWVHAERLIHTLQPLNDSHRQSIDKVRREIWELYRELKSYKGAPCPEWARTLSEQFDAIFTQRTSYVTLDRCLGRLHQHKDKLLLVLERPDIPLHTNGSERDIRDYVKKRKVSGGTRSDLGRRCRDTFASLKKTCRKLGLSFWAYLRDRHHDRQLPQLAELVSQRLADSAVATTL